MHVKVIILKINGFVLKTVSELHVSIFFFPGLLFPDVRTELLFRNKELQEYGLYQITRDALTLNDFHIHAPRHFQ